MMLEPAEAIQLEEMPQPRNGCAILTGFFLLAVMGGAMWGGLALVAHSVMQ